MSNIGILGSGRLTEELINVIIEKDIVVDSIHILDFQDSDSLGKRIKIEDDTYKIEPIEQFNFSTIDCLFVFSSHSLIGDYIKKALQNGVFVIDKSGYFVNDFAIPLVVCGINDSLLNLTNSVNVVSTPNCISLMLAHVLYPLNNNFSIQRSYVSTYQSVSGVGSKGLDELFEQTRGIYMNSTIGESSGIFTKQIAFNLIPHIGEFLDNSYTKEEESLQYEVNRLLQSHIPIVATCVRVPTFVGHALSVNIEFEYGVSKNEIIDLLKSSPNIIVVNHDANEGYVTPFETVGEDGIYVSRVRVQDNILSLWIVADNMKAGIILNMLEIYNKWKLL